MALSELVQRSRKLGFALLKGDGIEIGALHEPAEIPTGISTKFVDAISREKAQELFPEVNPDKFVKPDVIADLDRDGLRCFPDASLDFVVICHVLEHLANPILTIAEIFRVLRPNGRAAIAIPDKRFTFDRLRSITPFLHIWHDYIDQTLESSDEHYLDFLAATTTFITQVPLKERAEHIARAKARREHSHVWDSETFREALLLSIPLTGHRAQFLYESIADTNQFEYFAILEKAF